MPQLVPLYFLNQIIFGFAAITIILYILSKYILPRFLQIFITRSYLQKL